MVVKNLITVKFVVWLLLPTLLCHQTSQAQSYITDIQKLSVEDGLSSRFVNTIYQDSRGFMWIGTQYGLNRYDGYEFKIYTIENSTLSTNNIENLYEDKDQKLWVIHRQDPSRNVDILDLLTGKVQSFDQLFKGIAPFAARDISFVYCSAEKEMWITTMQGTLYRYNNNKFEFISSVPEQRSLSFIHADYQLFWQHLGIDKNNDFWLLQPRQKKLMQGYSDNGSLKTIDLEPLRLPEEMYKFNDSQRIHVNDTDGLIWWYHRYIPDVFLVIHPQKGIIFKMFDKIKPFLTHGKTQIFNIYPDTENRTWIATNDGVFIITLKQNKFTTLLSGEYEKYSIRAIIEDDQANVYISFYGGNAILDPEKGKLKIKKENYSVWLNATRDKQDNLWFSAQGPEIKKYTPLTGQSRNYITKPTDLKPSFPWEQWAIIRDKTGKIWTGTHRGLYSLEPETGLYQKFTRYNAFSQLGDDGIYHLYEDEKGIWIAASSGLYLLEPGKGITTRYATDEQIPYHIPYDHILHLYRDASGIFWLATKGGGLIRFNPEDGSYQQFTTTEGLSNNIIYAVYEDDYGKLWLPGNYGLMQFDKKTYRVNTYLTGDGIAHNEFNTASHYQMANGKLYLGGLSGVTVFHPKDFTTENPVPAPLRITGCRVLDGKTGVLTDKTATVSTSNELILSPSDKSFIIEYALLNYENSEQNSYAYKIGGLDKDWTTIGENSLRINALPYGNYVLQIKGQGIKGQASANELAISIIVNKPFYLKNGFILSSILALGLLLYGLFRWRLQSLAQAKLRLQETVKQRTKEIQRQKDKVEELNTTQSRWFTNIAHELRTPITLILGPIRQFLKIHPGASRKGIENIQLAEKNSLSLLKLVNDILDISRLDSNQISLNKQNTSLTRLIRESVAHFDAFATQKGVKLSIHIQENLELHIDKERIHNILVNLISNALRFTHTRGKVSISVSNEQEDGIKISVTDTGEGIPEKDLPHVFERYYQASHPARINQGGSGIGLALSMELARLHGGMLSAQSQFGKGSTFTLHLPQSLVRDPGKTASPKTHTMPPALLDNIPVASSTRKADQQQHILLVEDNPDMRQYIRGFMIDLYKITEAADGLEALKVLKKITPDLIISDIMMPRMDGITLAKMLKEDKHLKNIPFITLTAKTDETGKVAALRTGIDDYLTKPFNAEELQARAANLIHNYGVRKTASPTDPGTSTAPTYQNNVMAAMKDTVLQHLKDAAFTANDLATSRNMSLSSLRRLLKRSTGLSPGQFIREIRLQQARRFLEAKQYPGVAEVMYAVGFEKASYFTRLFSERFGKNPSEYL